jgi:hypothetical protein
LGGRNRPAGRAALLAVLAGLAACGGDAPEGAPAAADAPADSPAPPPAPAGGVRLLARREVAVAGRPVGVLARDVDGDGVDDAVVATRAPGTLAVLRGGREGLAQDQAPRPLGDDYPLGPVDLGARGFAVALQGARELLWFARPKDEPLRAALSAVPRALGAGDLDGDGDLEALAALADDSLAVLARDGRLERIPLGAELHGRATFLCALGPGRLAVGAQLDQSVLVLEVAGGAARELRRVPLGGIPRAARLSDVDGDGDAELAVVGGDSSVWVFGLGAGGGPGAWADAPPAPPRDLGAPGAVPLDLEAVDLDRDGRDELVLLDFYDSGFGVLGAFDAAGRPALAQKEYAGQDPVDAALGDFDGDGARDLAVANRSASRVSLLLGTGFAKPERVAFYQSKRVLVGQNPIRVRTGNLDADPLPEAVVLCAGDESVVVRTNRFGLLADEGPLLLRESGARALAVRDAPGGAEVALLVSRADRAQVLRLARDPADEPRVSEAGLEPRDLFWLRDGEGDVLAAVDRRGGALHLFGPGDGEVRRLAISAPPLAACAFELDGDARAELAVATAAELMLFDDLERPLAPVPIAVPGHEPEALAPADVDGDGRLDAVLLYGGEQDTAPGRVAVLLSEGGGHFRRAALAETGLAPAALAAGDVDGDGRAELFVAAQNSHQVNVWTPAAEGPFALRRLADIGAGLGPLDVHLADLDGDGRLDLVTANNFSHDLSVAYNLARAAR